MTSYKLTQFKKMVQVWKTKSLLFDKDMTHSSFFEEKLYNFHFHKNDVTWPLSANGLSITVWLTFWLHRICLHLFKHVELPAGRVECLKWLKLAQFNFFLTLWLEKQLCYGETYKCPLLCISQLDVLTQLPRVHYKNSST